MIKVSWNNALREIIYTEENKNFAVPKSRNKFKWIVIIVSFMINAYAVLRRKRTLGMEKNKREKG